MSDEERIELEALRELAHEALVVAEHLADQPALRHLPKSRALVNGLIQRCRALGIRPVEQTFPGRGSFFYP